MTPQDLTPILSVMTLVISIFVLVRTTKVQNDIEKKYKEIKVYDKALDKACETLGLQMLEQDNVLKCPSNRPSRCNLNCKECIKNYLLDDAES